MKVNSIESYNQSFTGFYNNKLLKRGLEFASDNGALFAAGTSLVLSTVARPLAILATPKTDKKNKEYACVKSIASSAVGYLLMLAASLPVARAVRKIDKAPEKFLKQNTIQTLKGAEKTLTKSKAYKLATQFFKLGLGFLLAAPKSVLTCALIPPVMSKIFEQKNDKNVSFKGKMTVEPISKGIGKIINTSFVQKMAEKFKNTNFAMHIAALTDTLATTTFICQTQKNKKINAERKKALSYNAAISTGLSVLGGYTLDKALENKTEKFIEKFKTANANSPKLDKYVEGIKIAKPVLILGIMYYAVIPIISTFLADRCGDKPNV